MKTTLEHLCHVLETEVDKHGVRNVLEALSLVCGQKADHIAVNWQDDDTARAWTYVAQAIGALAEKPSVKGVSAGCRDLSGQA